MMKIQLIKKIAQIPKEKLNLKCLNIMKEYIKINNKLVESFIVYYYIYLLNILYPHLFNGVMKKSLLI